MRRSTNPRSTVRRKLQETSRPNSQLPTPKPSPEQLGVGNWDSDVDPHAKSRRSFLCLSAAALASALTSSLSAQARITATDLGGATLFQGAGCNVIAMAGPDGALMIDG